MPDPATCQPREASWIKTGWLTLLILYVAACLFYNLSFPIMEGSDEPFHYGYIEQLRRGEGFPDPTQAPYTLAEYESSQAPLYYLTAAALLRIVPGIPDWDGGIKLNRWFGGQPVDYRDNKNLFLHNLDDSEEWFQGVGRGVRLARLVATLYGALAVLAAYLLAREIMGNVTWLPLLAASMVAFNPQSFRPVPLRKTIPAQQHLWGWRCGVWPGSCAAALLGLESMRGRACLLGWRSSAKVAH